ncbi:hypothetical protein ACQPZJ_32815 [Actinoplanes sp. CA-054009]
MEPLPEKLRAPARRFDRVPIPVDWVMRRFGVITREGLSFRSDGMVFYPAGAAEALEYHRDKLKGRRRHSGARSAVVRAAGPASPAGRGR